MASSELSGFLALMRLHLNNKQSVEQCEKELLSLGYNPEEIKGLRVIIMNMIDNVLDNYLSQFYERS